MEWIGPQADDEVQELFDKLFRRSTEVSGDCFFVADQAMVQEDVKKRLAKRGLGYDADACVVPSRELLLQMLPPGAAQRLEAYERLAPMAQSVEDGCYICDVQQWPASGCSKAGPHFPCQLTHGSITSLAKWRIAVGFEHLLAQGFHVFPIANAKYRSPLVDVLRKLPNENLKKLSGNTMSLPAFAAWIAFILSYCVPADPAARSIPPAPWTFAADQTEPSRDDDPDPDASGSQEEDVADSDAEMAAVRGLMQELEESNGVALGDGVVAERNMFQKGSSSSFG